MTNLQQIAGQPVVKRAFEVAAVASHPVLLVGPRGIGKETLADALRTLDKSALVATAEACWCGNYLSLTRECYCSLRAIQRKARQLRKAADDFDLLLEVAPVPYKELVADDRYRQTTKQARTRIEAARAFHAARGKLSARNELEALTRLLEPMAERTLELAARRLGMQAGEIIKTLRVALSIADLAESERLEARHVAEAVQYRYAWFLRWNPSGE